MSTNSREAVPGGRAAAALLVITGAQLMVALAVVHVRADEISPAHVH